MKHNQILFGEIERGQKVIVDAQGEGILGEFTFHGVPWERVSDDEAAIQAAEETVASVEGAAVAEME